MKTKAVFANLGENFSNRDASQAGKAQLDPILSKLEEIGQHILTLSKEEIGRLKNDRIVAIVDETYNVIIRLAQDPIMHSHMLGQMLMEKS